MPDPFAVAEQAENVPSAPPAGTESENVMLLPLSVPDTVPLAFVPLPLSVIVSVPEKLPPFWVIDHAITPGPDESVAVPDQVPARLAGVEDDDEEGEVGELPPPLHAAANSALPSSTPQRTPRSRVRFMVETWRILARQFDRLARASRYETL